MARAAKKQNAATPTSIADTTHLESLLQKAKSELSALQPQIDELESQLEKLRELKQQKQKLITLKLSIQSILNNFCNLPKNFNAESLLSGTSTETIKNRLNRPITTTNITKPYFSGTFLPDVALDRAAQLLRKKNSLNMELFRAIVFNGGQAKTEAIKNYLVENRIALPGGGGFFEDIALTEISSRVNYLIRKGLVTSGGRGVFVSTLGWHQPE